MFFIERMHYQKMLLVKLHYRYLMISSSCSEFTKVLKGLEYLHKKLHLIHRDIKPHNLLLNKLGEVKISDFGVSGQLAHTLSKAASWVGTVTYMSVRNTNHFERS